MPEIKRTIEEYILGTYRGDEKLIASVKEHYDKLPLFKGIIIEAKKFDDATRSFDAIASTPNADRDGDIMHADGWELKNFSRNPVLLWAHGYSDLPIGKCTNVRVEDGKLKFTPQFATAEEYPFADTVYKLFKGGYINAFSVGFDPKQWAFLDNGGTEFFRQELLEISACPVPVNPEALADKDVQVYLKKQFGIKICSSCKGAPAPVPPVIIPTDGKILSPFQFKDMGEMVELLTIIREGRVISDDNRAGLLKGIKALQDAIGTLSGIVEMTAPKPEVMKQVKPEEKQEKTIDLSGMLEEAQSHLR